MKTLLLIDGHAMIHRAFHALPETMTTKDGMPTNAIYGFFMMLQKAILEFRPTHLAVCFDTPKPTFRKELFAGYQAKRPSLDDGLRVQIPHIKKLLTSGGVQCLEKPGFEADDVIGTVAEAYKKSIDRVIILTGDRDLLQLSDKNVFVILPKKGVSEFVMYSPEQVEEKFGVDPLRIPDYKALAGDASDNYNTAKGIGPKTAQKLLDQFHTIEKLLKNVDQVENERWRQVLSENKDTIILFKKIATIVRDVPVETKEFELAFDDFKEPMKDELKHLQLYTVMNKLFEQPLIEEVKKVPKSAKKKETPLSDQIDLFN